MIAGRKARSAQKTAQRNCATILLSALTIIFLIVLMSMKAFGIYQSVDFSITVLVALARLLIPTTIGGLLSAIGNRGHRPARAKDVLAMSGRAVEAAGDVMFSLLERTGTINAGNRPGDRITACTRRDQGSAPRCRRSSPRWRTRPRKAVALSCWPRKTACAGVSCTSYRTRQPLSRLRPRPA